MRAWVPSPDRTFKKPGDVAECSCDLSTGGGVGEGDPGAHWPASYTVQRAPHGVGDLVSKIKVGGS